MESGKIGIKETKDMLKFVLGLGMALDKSLADKKFSVDDIGNFVSAFLSAGEAFEGVKEIGAELKDLDAAELEEINEFVKKELELENEKVEAIVESGLGLGVQIYQLVLEIRNILKAKDDVLPVE